MSLTTNTSSSMSRSGTTKRSPAAGAHNTPAFRSRPACSIVITLPSSPHPQTPRNPHTPTTTKRKPREEEQEQKKKNKKKKKNKSAWGLGCLKLHVRPRT